MFKVVSLFCGCGGCDQGVIGNFVFNGKKYPKLSTKIVYSTDIDTKALATLKLNFPEQNIVHGDICETDSSTIPDHDILMGGFPCQSFSTVNPTKNPNDKRANLFKEMVRILQDKQPKAFIAENVKGLFTLQKGKIFEKVCNAFDNAGYNLHYKLINSADYGVPQKRERIIIIGFRKDLHINYEFPEATCSGKWVPLSTVISKLDLEEKKYYFSERAVMGMKNAKNNMKRGLAQDLEQPCLTITSHLAKASLNSRDPVLLVDREKEIYRRFTPREAASIQSFPQTYLFAGSELDAYRQIGNAVPPVMMWYIAKSVCEALKEARIETEETVSVDTKLHGYREYHYYVEDPLFVCDRRKKYGKRHGRN